MAVERHRPLCRIDYRVCQNPTCAKLFTTVPQVRRKYCSDLCAAIVYAGRSSNRCTVEGALSHIQRVKVDRVGRLKVHVHREESALPAVPRNPIANTHRPGSIAFALLYGGPTFTLSVGDDRVGRGGGRNARQVGGPNL